MKQRDEEGLKLLLEKLELQYDIMIMQEQPKVIVVLDVTLDTPFSVMGIGNTKEEAKRNVLEKTFQALELYICAIE